MKRVFLLLAIVISPIALVFPGALVVVLILAILAILSGEPPVKINPQPRRPTKTCLSCGTANRVEDYRCMGCGGPV
jgi:hypothetical protein